MPSQHAILKHFGDLFAKCLPIVPALVPLEVRLVSVIADLHIRNMLLLMGQHGCSAAGVRLVRLPTAVKFGISKLKRGLAPKGCILGRQFCYYRDKPKEL